MRLQLILHQTENVLLHSQHPISMTKMNIFYFKLPHLLAFSTKNFIRSTPNTCLLTALRGLQFDIHCRDPIFQNFISSVHSPIKTCVIGRSDDKRLRNRFVTQPQPIGKRIAACTLVAKASSINTLRLGVSATTLKTLFYFLTPTSRNCDTRRFAIFGQSCQIPEF